MTSHTITVDVGDDVVAQLVELEADTPFSRDALLADAVGRLHRIYLGEAALDLPSTGPFTKQYSELPAEVVLRQVDPTLFEVREPIRYTRGPDQFVVPNGDKSNLASVPGFLLWLVPRYGRHTLAALLHDYLQGHIWFRRDRSDDAGKWFSSARADEIFRDAMRDNHVPLLRRWIMWTAVALRTQFKSSLLGAAGTILWSAIFALVGIALPPLLAFNFWAHWVSGPTAALVVGAAVAAPILASVLWGRKYRCGLISGLAMVLVGATTFFVVLNVLVYFALEWLLQQTQPEKAPSILIPDRSTE